MEYLNTILPETYRIAIGWTILHSIWQIALVSITFYFFLRLNDKKSASWKYKLSFSSLLFIMMVSAITFRVCLSNTTVLPNDRAIHVSSANNLDTSISPETDYSSYIFSKIEDHIPLLVNIWFVGAALFIFRLGSNFSAINNLKKSAKVNIPDRWIRFADTQKLKMGIGRNLSMLSSTAVTCPITFGNIKPIILIPASLIFHLSPAQLEAIITHEMAHIKRKDYLHNIIQSAMEAIFFYHPCFWWINGYVREQRENACDDMAIHYGVDPKDLAYGLAEVLNHAHELSPEIALAAGARNQPTLSRIKRMLGFENNKTKFPSLISYTMIFTMLISASLVLGANHVSTLENDNFLVTDAHFSPNVPWNLPYNQVQDTIPSKKEVYIINTEGKITEKDSANAPHMKKRLIIINGDTQRVYLPAKPMIAFLNDSLLGNFPRIKLDSVMINKFRNFELDSALQKKFRTFNYDTVYFEKDIIKKLERNAKEMESYSKELEAQIRVWTEKNQPKLDELQQKLKEKEVLIIDSHEKFSKEIGPHLKELEKKMEEWQKEFSPKMEEFHQKMELWQKENSKQIEELQKAIQESLKKGDN